MSERACATCGKPEERKLNAFGATASLNLNPITGLCVDCEVNAAAARHTFPRTVRAVEPVDSKAKAARNDD